MRMGLGIFQGNSQVENMRIEHDPFIRYLEKLDSIMFFGVDLMVFIGSQSFAQVNIVGI